MIKIKKKVKFEHKENKLKNEGDIINSRNFFYSTKSKNLTFLMEKRFNWMNKYIDSDSTGLEVGAGPGLSKEFIKCKNFKISDYTECDFLDFKNVNILKTSFPDNAFDFIISSNVIHHVPYPIVFFEEMKRILKKNGKLIIQDVNCSLIHQILTIILKHEGFNFESNVFSKKECSTDEKDLWSGNIAIPNLLFDDINKFKQNVSGFKLAYHNYSEFLCLVNSGGVIAKTFYIPLNRLFFNLLDFIDKFLIKIFPSIFAFQCQVVLIKE